MCLRTVDGVAKPDLLRPRPLHRTRPPLRAMLAAVGGLALSALPLGAARAAPIAFNFSYTSAGISASGVLDTNGVLSGGFYTVTGISGTRNGVAISGLNPPSGFGNPDNLLSPTSPFVDFAGIGYGAGGLNYNFFSAFGGGCGGVYEVSTTVPIADCGIQLPATLTVVPAATLVPEPATFALLGGSVLGAALLRLGLTARRARRARG